MAIPFRRRLVGSRWSNGWSHRTSIREASSSSYMWVTSNAPSRRSICCSDRSSQAASPRLAEAAWMAGRENVRASSPSRQFHDLVGTVLIPSGKPPTHLRDLRLLGTDDRIGEVLDLRF